VSLLGASDCPFDFANGSTPSGEEGGDNEAFLPPLLTRLRVDTLGSGIESGVPSGELWVRGEALLVSARSLVALSPSLLSLSAARARLSDGESESGGGDDGGDPRAPRPASDGSHVNPMGRLIPALSSLSRLTCLELDGDFDWCVGARGEHAWLLLARSVLSPLNSLRRLVLCDAANSGTSHSTDLPPALLTGLTCLEVHAWLLHSAGPIRRLTQLARLTVDNCAKDEEEEDDDLPHPPVLDRDLAALTRLAYLHLSHSAPCHAPVIRTGLPRLSTLVMADFWPPALAEAARLRMQRDGVRVYRSEAVEHMPNHWDAPEPLSDDDLDELLEEMGGVDSDDERKHGRLHSALVDKVRRSEREEEAALA
jgi:hypothetical protein